MDRDRSRDRRVAEPLHIRARSFRTYRVLLREGEDGADYTLERTYKSIVSPKPGGGPYLSQEGDVFFVDELVETDRLIRGWRPV
jgi:hypothetical protein